jgi:lipopolysaccharide transport system ATP-binding protein
MKTASIELDNVEVVFPIFNAASLSLKNRILSAFTGGGIDRDHNGIVIVKGLLDINLKINPGERVGLIGHNGAGKTTLLRVLSGIYQPTHGFAKISGECVSLINIGLGIDPEATGRENILLRGVMMGMRPDAIKQISEEIIDFSGLGKFIDLPFRTYSTGMQLRLAFAVSTALRPQILIMDEWLSTGDEEFKERADRRLSEVVSAAEILILASHSHELLMNNCNRLICLERGKITMDGSAEVVAKTYFRKRTH